MSRPLRLEQPHGWYHVINRGKNHHDIYRCDEDFRAFHDVLKNSCARYDVKVAAFCYMSNHYHLLVYTPNGNLSQFMRQVNGCYVQQHHRRYGTDGPLFKGRFKSFLVDRENYLTRVARYIHRNPVEAGLPYRIWEYPWSSHRLFLKPDFREPWFAKDELLEFFGKSYQFAMENFLEFMRQDVDPETEKFYSGLFPKAIIGARDYADRVKEQWVKSNTLALTELPAQRQIRNEVLTLKVLHTVADDFMVKADDVLVKRRGAPNWPRKFALCLVRDLCNLPLKQTARIFDMKSYKSVGVLYQRYMHDLRASKERRSRYRELKRRCAIREE